MLSQKFSHQHQQGVLGLLYALCKQPAVRVRHVLGYADEIARRCNVNGELPADVARKLGFDRMAVLGLAKLLRAGKWSPERLACVAMMDPCLDDHDIGEIFNRSERWARVVRSQAEEIRADEPMPRDLEWFDPGFQPDDPLPDEILRRAMELRGRSLVPGMRDSYRAGIRCYSRSENSGAFLPIGVA